MNSLRALFAVLVIGCSMNSVYATEIELPKELIQKDQIGEDWTYIQTTNGIAVSYSVVVIEDERFLSIQFENTNAEAVDFIWSLLHHNSAVTITIDGMIESIVQLKSNDTETVNGTYLIEMKSDDELSDFVVLIKPTKR